MAPILGIWASQGRVVAGDYESIATVTVGSGGASSVTFNSIPNTYTHLQLRCLVKTSSATWIPFTVNSDTASQRTTHFLRGNGSSASAGVGLGSSGEGNYAALTDGSQWGAIIVDLLDYANTNKNKTTRVLWGVDNNGSGSVGMSSVLHFTNGTAAVTSVSFNIGQYTSGINFDQYSHFALYGIRSA